MKYYLIGTGYTDMKKGPSDYLICSVPFEGVQRVNKIGIAEFKGKLENAIVTNRLEVIGIPYELERYTLYDENEKQYIKTSNTIIDRTLSNNNEMFLITDGILSPKWVTKEQLMHSMTHGGKPVSNAKFIFEETSGWKVIT
jgi:hypothetical protein